MSKLSIFILCHNRPTEARQAILSVLNQADSEYSLIISDNSSNNGVEELVKAEFPSMQYIRRHPVLQPLDHFNRCIDEANSDYFCLFHDDDLMHANFVQEMKKTVRAYPQAIALGCNAVIEVNGRPQPATSFRSFQNIVSISSARDLAARYFARSQSGIAPFPGYVYKKHLVGNLRLPTGGGKYADATWLINLARQGSVIWVNKPLMTYRLHGGNDSNSESRRDRLRSLAYLKKNLSWLGRSLLHDYRCSFIYKTLLKSPDQTPGRKRLAANYLNYYSLARYVRPPTYVALARRALDKWIPRF
jgi:glycosyltransferase involved in cell wall biosynthesis